MKAKEKNICSRVVAATASLAGGAAHAGSIPGGCFPNPGSIPAGFLSVALGPQKNLVTLLDLCVSSLRRGHANLLCIVPIFADDLFRGSACSVNRALSSAPAPVALRLWDRSKTGKKSRRGCTGIEPVTSRTQSENHTTRPTAHSKTCSTGFEPATPRFEV